MEMRTKMKTKLQMSKQKWTSKKRKTKEKKNMSKLTMELLHQGLIFISFHFPQSLYFPSNISYLLNQNEQTIQTNLTGTFSFLLISLFVFISLFVCIITIFINIIVYCSRIGFRKVFRNFRC